MPSRCRSRRNIWCRSACSIAIGIGIVDTTPGSIQGLHLVVPDIQAARAELAERGVKVVLCEKGHIAGEQSSRNWGWCRRMGRDPAEIPLSVEALRQWEGMDARLGEAMAAGMSVRDAAAAVAEATGLPRRQVYARALEMGRDARPK